jgi:hypothetical protein
LDKESKLIAMEGFLCLEDTPLFGDLLVGLSPAADEGPFSFDNQLYAEETWPVAKPIPAAKNSLILPIEELPLFENDFLAENPILQEFFDKISPFLLPNDASASFDEGLDSSSSLNVYDQPSSDMPYSSPSWDGLSAGYTPSANDVQAADTVLSPASLEDIESTLCTSPDSFTPDGEFGLEDSPTMDMYDNSYSVIDGSTDSYSVIDASIDSWEEYLSQHALIPKDSLDTKGQQRKKPYSRKKNGASQYRDVDKKDRKKVQNKCAASRYRQKKKEELETADQECERLEKTNKQLKGKVESITHEIQYLKQLMKDVLQAKKLKNSKGKVA